MGYGVPNGVLIFCEVFYGFKSLCTLSKARKKNGRKSIYYFYYYDDCGKKIRHSTGMSTKTKARDYVLNLIAQGKLREIQKKDISFGEFSRPFWVWNTCPIIQDKILRGGHYSTSLNNVNIIS